MKSGSHRRSKLTTRRLKLVLLTWRRIRSACLVLFLSSLVLTATACTRNVRTVNDNFYVINGRSDAAKPKPAASPTPSVPDPQLSRSISEALKTQPGSGPQPKRLLSNAGSLEEENPTIASLLHKAQANREDPQIQFELGRAYQDFRLYDAALFYYEAALRLDPMNPHYHEQVARLMRDWGSLEVGVKSVQTALDLDKAFVEAWNTLGTILDQQGKQEQAQDGYLRALSLDDSLDYVHSNLCFSYLQSGKVEQAVHHCERAVSLNPALVVAHNNLGLAYGVLGELDRSLDAFRQAGDEAGARNNFGLVLLKRGQITEAMEQFRLAARMRPFFKDAVANYWRSRELKFQKVREARVRLRSFDRETAMEAKPGAFQFGEIDKAGLLLLGNSEELLFAPLPASRPGPIVEFEIEAFACCTFDESRFRQIIGTGRFRLNRVLVSSARPKRTIVYYKEGYAKDALDLAHSIPGNQTVLQAPSSHQSAALRVSLGLDFARLANLQSNEEHCTNTTPTVRH